MKPTVYEGKEPFIFASYAHKDCVAVYEVLNELQKRGYRLWYDYGIEPGSEWPEDIARHLDAAAVVLAFITPAAMSSTNCRREINFSLSREKPFLSIVLEPTEMSLGMEMQLSAQQMVVRQSFNRWDDFIDKILSYPGIEPCRSVSRAINSGGDTPTHAASPIAATPSSVSQTDSLSRPATVVLDPGPNEGGSRVAQNDSAAVAARQATASWSHSNATPTPQPAPNGQAPFGSNGTVWAGASGYVAQQPNAASHSAASAQSPAQQPYQPTTPAQQPQAYQAYGSNPDSSSSSFTHAASQSAASNPTPTPAGATGHGTNGGNPSKAQHGKRTWGIIAGAAAAVIAVAALLFAFGPFHAKDGGDKPPERSPELAEVVAHPPFMLEDLVSGTTDDTIDILKGLTEYQDEYDERYFTADEEMATFYTDLAPRWDDEGEEEQNAYLSEHASSLPWQISSYYDDSSVSLASMENEGVNPMYWDYGSYLNCSNPTCEDVAAYVAEAFDYDGIALYRITAWGGNYRITGRALSDEAALYINVYPDNIGEKTRWFMYLSVDDIDAEWSKNTIDNFVYLCKNESLRSSLEEVYIVEPDEACTVYQDALGKFDEAAYEANLRGLSTSIGSDFEIPFDLANLLNSSPEDVAGKLDGLTEVVTSGTYSDGDEWMDAYYTASEDMGNCMELDVDGDGYSGGSWNYRKNSLDSAPWYVCLFDDYQFATRESIASGGTPEKVHFYGMVPADDLTCEDVARYVEEVYAFDQAIIYMDPDSNKHEISGYARTDNTTAMITGEPKTNDPIDAPNIGTYRIEVEVADLSDSGLFDSFQETYNNAKLPERYPDSFKK